MKTNSWGVILVGLILILALVAVGPVLIIWSINTLFPVVAVEYTIWTWLAVIILFGAVRANVTVKRRD